MVQHTLIDRKCVDFFFFFSLLSRRRRHQPTVMDEREQKVSTGWEGWEGVIWLNFHTPSIFCLRRGKERHIRTRPSTASPRNFFRRRRCGQSTYDHERKRTDVIKAVGTVGRGYLVKFLHPMYFLPSWDKLPWYNTRSLTESALIFFFFFPFLAVDAGTSLRSWTNGNRRYQRDGKGGKGLYG